MTGVLLTMLGARIAALLGFLLVRAEPDRGEARAGPVGRGAAVRAA